VLPDGSLVGSVAAGLSVWANVVVLAGIAAGVRLLAMGLLELTAWRKCM
jgi:hypothetical protein